MRDPVLKLNTKPIQRNIEKISGKVNLTEVLGYKIGLEQIYIRTIVAD
jgi:hypothetical protein